MIKPPVKHLNKSDVARTWRKKYPKKASLALARIMYKKEFPLFGSVESARSSLRYVEGKQGANLKKQLGTKAELVIEEPRPYNPYKLPDSDETSYEPYIFKGHKRVAIFADLHIPYHKIDSLTAAIQFCKKEKPDGLLLNGDVLDFHAISRFQKDPRKKSFATELSIFKQIFEIFENEFKCQIYFKLGNHDERYENFLMQKAGELIGVEEFEFHNIIKARAKGIEVIGEKRVMHLNSLRGIHGHEYIGGISAPVNVARGLYLKGKVSAFQGHSHVSSSHTESDMNGKLVTTWSIGCLCELHPMYLRLNKWNTGFAIVDLDANKEEYNFRNYSIYKGKIY